VRNLVEESKFLHSDEAHKCSIVAEEAGEISENATLDYFKASNEVDRLLGSHNWKKTDLAIDARETQRRTLIHANEVLRVHEALKASLNRAPRTNVFGWQIPNRHELRRQERLGK